MSAEKIAILQRALTREKSARKEAEKILEEKAAELYALSQELSQTNTRLEKNIEQKISQLQVFESIIDAYVVVDFKGEVLKMNESAIALLGYDFRKAPIFLLDLVEEKMRERTQAAFSTLIKEGLLKNFQLEIFSKDGQQKIVQINASMLYDENKVPIAAQGIARDITKQQASESRLISSESRLTTLITNLDSGVLLEDEQRKIVLTNKKFCELFSIPVSPSEMVGLDCSNAAAQNKHYFLDPIGFVEGIEKIIRERKLALGEILTFKDGRIFRRDYIPIFKDKEFQGNLWSYKDITLETKYQQSIEVEKQKYSSIIANMKLGLLEVDNDEKIAMLNQSFSEMSGYSEEELIGKKASTLFLEGEQSDVNTLERSRRNRGLSNSYELEVKTKQGESRCWLISGAPNYNLNGKVIGSIGIHLDITDMKNLEIQKEILFKKLKKSNAELQEYAHIVSHDLKSPLRSINALVNWLKEDNKGFFDASSLRNFSLIENTLEKMENLISGILNYSSIVENTEKYQQVDLNILLEELKVVIYFPAHISLKVTNKLPKISGDPIRLQQLFQNLLINAIQHIDKEKGLIEARVVEHLSYYQFSVKDNGIGIDKQYHNKIFKIFQSLNTHNESTGIGLSIVKKIVDLYKGEIWLESEVGVGTTFYFTLMK
jgi:PAS domain S-box-containing protein